MRPALLLGGMLSVFCGICWTVHAQTSGAPNLPPLPEGSTNLKGGMQTPVLRTVTVGEVEVRSGPTTKFYPTAKLRKGDKVVVLKEVSKPGNNWLAIKPPPGSFSWINKRFIQKKGQFIGVVIAPPDADVPIRPGSTISNQPPNIEAVKLKRGALVVILDDTPVYSDSGAWLPIDVTPEEVRYIPADAVEGSNKENYPITPGNNQTNPRVLLAQAEQARQAGNFARARQLYSDAAAYALTYEERISFMQKVDDLIRVGGGSQGAQYQPGNPYQTSTNSPSGVFQTTQRTTARFPMAGNANPAKQTHTAQKTVSAKWSGWGTLRRTSFRQQGQPMYVLEQKGQPLLYAVTRADLTLDPYVGRTICLWGSVHYRSDEVMRQNYMQVSYVALP